VRDEAKRRRREGGKEEEEEEEEGQTSIAVIPARGTDRITIIERVTILTTLAAARAAARGVKLIGEN